MNSNLTRFAGVTVLSLTICRFAPAQNPQPPNLPNIQKLESNAVKIGVIGAAATAGVTVIGLVVRHRHKSHARSSKLEEYKALAVRARREAALHSVTLPSDVLALRNLKATGDDKLGGPVGDLPFRAQTQIGSRTGELATNQGSQ